VCALQALFLNLLFKSVKVDPELGRVKAFLKRILQVCTSHAPPFVCGCLIMLSEVSDVGVACQLAWGSSYWFLLMLYLCCMLIHHNKATR